VAQAQLPRVEVELASDAVHLHLDANEASVTPKPRMALEGWRFV
jgi:hypothetical protein